MSTEIETSVAASGLDIASIKSASVRGLAVTSIAQVVRLAVQFISSILLARLLLPADFGLVAMAGPLVAFVQLLAELGLTQATVQRPTITQRELSFLFWLGLATSIALGGIVMLAAPLAGIFYHEPRVTGVVVALGAITMFGGAYAQHTALLNRSLRFGALAIVDVASLLAGAVAGISAAWSGQSYWSIVISQATTTAVALLLAWSLSRWVPSSPQRGENVRELLGFGGNVTAFNLVNFFARNLDNILIGRYLGGVELGLYDRAYKLLLFPLSQITSPVSKVAIPTLSRLILNPAAYKATYFRLLDLVLLLTFPLALYCCFNSKELIGTVLGPQWNGAVRIFQVLSVGALFAPIGNSTSWLLISQGRTTELKNYGIISSIAFVGSFIVGLRWGAVGVAACYISVGVVQGPIIWYFTTRVGPVSTRRLAAKLLPYLIASLATALFNVLVASYVSSGLVGIMFLLSMNYIVFVLALALTGSGRATIAPYLTNPISLIRSIMKPVAS